MAHSQKKITESITSDKLHNKNCFNYLRKIKLPPSVIELKLLPPEIMEAISTLQKGDYDPTFPYGDLYTKFFDYLEDNIETIFDETRSNLLLDCERIENYQQQVQSNQSSYISPDFQRMYIHGLGVLPSIKEINKGENALNLKVERLKYEAKALDDFILSIYANDNHILEDTFETIKEVALTHTPSSPSLNQSISHHIRDKEERINRETRSPADEEKTIIKVSQVLSNTFKPQHGTGLATIRHYKWNKDGPIEYRFGTQAQRHHGEARANPLFERFLKIEAEREEARVIQAKKERAERLSAGKVDEAIEEEDIDEDRITHVYINLLGRDRTDIEGSTEKALTEQLEALEQHTDENGVVVGHKNVAVITLPADRGLMQKDQYTSTEPKHKIDDLKKEFFLIASESPDAQTYPRDFHISERIRKKIFCNEKGQYSAETEAKILNELIDKSFKALGYPDNKILSDAERQAVYFHFIKFELTNHILESLKPNSYNFTCKDAIDRGGVASAYYNVVKSFEPLTPKEKQAGKERFPMTREEFEQGLHAAPTLVKGRGINHHINLIWNSVDTYVNQNYQDLKKDPAKAWLIEWRDYNCPHERVEGLLKQRVHECIEELDSRIKQESTPSLEQGRNVLKEIEQQTSLGVSGKRLLLEATLKTTSMAISPNTQTKETCNRYQELHDQLSIKYPQLKVLGGLMKVFAGTVINAVLSAVSAVSFGKIDIKSDLASKGWATFNAGYNLDSRKSLQMQMKDQLHSINPKLDSDQLNSINPKLDSPQSLQTDMKDQLNSIRSSANDENMSLESPKSTS